MDCKYWITGGVCGIKGEDCHFNAEEARINCNDYDNEPFENEERCYV